MLLLLGDQVEDGDDAEQWAYFDQVSAPIRECEIPTWALLGNHDYGATSGQPTDQAWRRHFHARFPHQGSDRLTEIPLDDYVLLAVDSNLPTMTDSEIAGLHTSFSERLAELDERSGVRGVIVAMHHPPFTNGGFGFGISFSASGMVETLQPLFATPFLESRKTVLFLSGHAHSYQRFVPRPGKEFVVSGGGGGPRHTIDVDESRRFHCDARVLKTVRERPFHYLTLDLRSNGIRVQARMLDRDSDRFYVGDSFCARSGAGRG